MSKKRVRKKKGKARSKQNSIYRSRAYFDEAGTKKDWMEKNLVDLGLTIGLAPSLEGKVKGFSLQVCACFKLIYSFSTILLRIQA